MHTLNADKGTKFHYSPGFEGVVTVQPDPKLSEDLPEISGFAFNVPMEDLIELVVEQVRTELIFKIENMTPQEFLVWHMGVE